MNALDPKGTKAFDPARLVAMPPRITTARYRKRDTMLYALGVGAGQDPKADDLKFVYEEGLEALPTMAVMLAYPGFWQKEPEYGIDWKRVLHVGQSCTFHRPLPVEASVRGELTVDAIADKGAGKGCLLRAVRQIYDVNDDGLIATVRQTSLLRGDGGHGSHGGELPDSRPVPDRQPDSCAVLDTRPEQALIYRLSGDYNPLHADPQVAAAAGFDAPILHGLCTYGIAGRAVLAWACGNDPSLLRSLECRFTAPVFPGEELLVEMWRCGRDDIAFRVSVPARQAVVLDHGSARTERAKA